MNFSCVLKVIQVTVILENRKDVKLQQAHVAVTEFTLALLFLKSDKKCLGN